MYEYFPILILLVIGVVFPVVTLLFAKAIRASKEGEIKLEPYECGIETREQARDRYSVRYYIISVLFVVFDVETIFLFPWAVKYHFLRLFGLIEMGIFLIILLIGYFYAWKKGALEWV
ncbi:MAG: NADH-quinone oxidoreductase subunit A [Acidobacteriota bacterium]